jgi:hypothetical protein
MNRQRRAATSLVIAAGLLVAGGCGWRFSPGGPILPQSAPVRILVQNATQGPLVVRATGKTVAYYGVPVGQTVEIPDDPQQAFAIFDEQCRSFGGRDDRGIQPPQFIMMVVSNSGGTGVGSEEPPVANFVMATPVDSHC